MSAARDAAVVCERTYTSPQSLGLANTVAFPHSASNFAPVRAGCLRIMMS